MAIYQDQSSASNDTIQTINSAISANGSAWGSTIAATLTTSGQTLTLPVIAIPDIGRSITCQNAGTNAFTLAIASGTITSAIGLIINPGSTVVVRAVSVASAIVVSTNAAQNIISETGEAYYNQANSAIAANSIIMSFTLPSAGTWDVEAQIATNFNTFGSGHVYFRNSAGVEVPYSRVYIQGGTQGAMSVITTVRAKITTTGAEICQLFTDAAIAAVYGYNVPTPAQGGTKVSWEKVSQQAATTGQSVDYVTFLAQPLALTQAGGIVDTTMNTIIAGNIPVTAGGLISLIAGKTYRFEAEYTATSVSGVNPYLRGYITDSSNVNLPSSGQSVIPAVTNTAWSEINSARLSHIYTPSTNQQVKFRVEVSATSGGTANLNTNGSKLSVIQLGSSAIIAASNPITTKFTASGTYTPTPGMKYVEIEAIGGGGNGGGGPNSVAGQTFCGSGGGAGSLVRVRLTAAQIGSSQTVTIGAGGVGNGSAGAPTSLGALFSAGGGGSGSWVGTAAGNPGAANLAASPNPSTWSITTGTDLGSGSGMVGQNGQHIQGQPSQYSAGFGGKGGDTKFSIGGALVQSQGTPTSSASFVVNGCGAGGTNSAVQTAVPNTGAGGGGTAGMGNTTATAGGNGSSGVMFITEVFG